MPLREIAFSQQLLASLADVGVCCFALDGRKERAEATLLDPALKFCMRLVAITLLITIILVSLGFSLTPSETPHPPQFRLPPGAAPTHYLLDLTVAPDKDTFTGFIEISIHFSQSMPALWLNAQNLSIKDAILEIAGQKLKPAVLPQPKDFVGFVFDRSIGPGDGVLHVSYEGKVSRNDMEGIFQRKDGDHSYVYSQFENISARKAMPCFDEPGFKVPWQLTLHVPREFNAYSNTAALTEREEPGLMKAVTFAETKPLPSYLVAIAVGAFEIFNARDAGAKKTAVRILYPQGHSGEAAFAAKVTPDVLEYLEQYFGIPYPYDKLDEVAIPLAPYAMEHPGLVTYGAGFFLVPPDHEDIALQRTAAAVVAHELAHQWFGDLVTTEWWDDTWLNEGFASWMGNKIIRQYHPEWNSSMDDLNSVQSAMVNDELLSARKVRQPIENNNDISNAFDGITYDKGAGLLAMFESFVGPEKFKQRIHNYLEKYAWKNATSSDFLDAIAGGDPALNGAFSSFLNQPGVPILSTKLRCESGKPVLHLSQQRFLPRGSKDTGNQLWGVPVCVRYGSNEKQGQECTLLTAKTASFRLGTTEKCLGWYYGNANQSGYYHVDYGSATLKELVNGLGRLSPEERLGLLGDISALTRSSMPRGESLALISKFAAERNRHLVAKTTDLTGGIDNYLVPPELRPQYQAYLRNLYKFRTDELGMVPKASDSPDDRLLRDVLIGIMGTRADDPAVVKESTSLATEWLRGDRTPDPDTFDSVISVAAIHGDRQFFDLLRKAAKSEQNEARRFVEMASMGIFRDPRILRDALALVTTDEFDSRDAIGVWAGAKSFPYSARIAFDFLRQNWDAVLRHIPVDMTLYIPSTVSTFCDPEQRSEVELFFRPRVAKLEGGPRALDQVLERIDVCIVNKRANQASVESFLKNYESQPAANKP